MNSPTILECAKSGDLVGMVMLLVSDPSLLNVKSNLTSQTPLHESSSHNKVEVVKYLLDWRGMGAVELEASNIYGETPLHLAAKNGCNETARLLLSRGAYIEARTSSWMTPLHLAVRHAIRTGNNSIVKTLTESNADCSALDEDDKSPFSYLPEESENEELRKLLIQYEEGPSMDNKIKRKMDDFSHELSKIVGLKELKMQLQRWAKGMLMDKRRRSIGIDIGPRKPPHMAFLGNPGTGKTTVARILGKLLLSVGVLSSDKVTEVQRSDLVAEYVGQTGPKTKKKIKEAMGGILFVDEAYRLAPEQGSSSHTDFGVEALEEIMSVMEDGKHVIIFAGYTEPMRRVFSTNEGFTRRVTHFFQFENFTCRDLAKMLLLKMTKQGKESRWLCFKLHSSCTLDAVTAIIEKNSSEDLRNKMNGGLVDHMLNNARENLDSRLPFDSNRDELLTITLTDLEAGLKQMTKRINNQ